MLFSDKNKYFLDEILSFKQAIFRRKRMEISCSDINVNKTFKACFSSCPAFRRDHPTCSNRISTRIWGSKDLESLSGALNRMEIEADSGLGFPNRKQMKSAFFSQKKYTNTE